MAVHLALIYHIHNFLGAGDKSLRAALVKNKAQTLIHPEENTATSVPKNTLRSASIPIIAPPLPYVQFPDTYGCKSCTNMWNLLYIYMQQSVTQRDGSHGEAQPVTHLDIRNPVFVLMH